eukprot:m.237400 g.237400  ORF g.237400 m.237400 type:complete len:327 (-) comp19369_c0_seq8:867-1847(-)
MFACAFGCQATKRIIHSHLAFPRVSMRQFTFPASLWGTGVKILGTIDCHAAGEPARVVISGMPSVAGRTMMEKRIVLMNEMDHFRKLLLQEPRGYPCQNANIIFPSDAAGVQFGYVILEQNKIYPAMSGHNTICVATALLETGMIQMEEPETIFDLESPAGLIRIHAACEHGRVTRVSLDNTPAFVEHLDKEINVPHFGRVRLDVAFGGMWYAVVNASTIGLDLAPENGKEICRIGEMIKVAAKEQLPVYVVGEGVPCDNSKKQMLGFPILCLLSLHGSVSVQGVLECIRLQLSNPAVKFLSFVWRQCISCVICVGKSSRIRLPWA